MQLLCVGSDSKMSRARGEDARTGDSKPLGRRIESATANFFFQGLFLLFLFLEMLF